MMPVAYVLHAHDIPVAFDILATFTMCSSETLFPDKVQVFHGSGGNGDSCARSPKS